MKHSLKVALAILVYSIPCLLRSNVIAQQEPTNLLQYKQVELWNIYEIKLDGHQAGNPFLDGVRGAKLLYIILKLFFCLSRLCLS